MTELDAHRSYLWAVCYRTTGSAADADDLVQETFLRALERPPAETSRPWRPWLLRVAMNLCRDALRRRQRREYVGPWLPSPVPTEVEGPAFEPSIDGRSTTAGRYELMESVSLAFLLALEALTPSQRAVLLLRDVFDYSVRQAAEALDLRETNVKTTLHRARAAMGAYDRTRRPPSSALTEQTSQALGRMIMALGNADHAALGEVLAEEITAFSDGAGEFFAARKPLVGREKVVRFYANITSRRGIPATLVPFVVNGRPALLLEWNPDEAMPREPPRAVLTCDVDAQGRVTRLYTMMATDKLSEVQRWMRRRELAGATA